MRSRMFFISLFLIFLLGNCGDNSDIGRFAALFGEGADPWINVGKGVLSEDVTETVRAMEFGDGMIVSYDGSDEGGAEEVCRTHRRTGAFYEICMSLEDDPYFEFLEMGTFMFESFHTSLLCRSWREGDRVKTVGVCREMFLLLGGPEFRCYAGVRNGDRALLCTDEWGVLVNGEDGDTKTLCRVHLESDTGYCLGAPEDGVPDSELIRNMPKSSWGGIRSSHANSRQALMGDVLQAMTPQNLPEGAVVNYYSRDGDVCTIDNDNSDGGVGSITVSNAVMIPSQCTIVVKISAKDFVDWVFYTDLQVVRDNDARWADYILDNGFFYVGESLIAGALTSTDPASPDVEYSSADESICTVDGSGTVTAEGVGVCRVSLTATAEDYLDVVIEKRMDVLELGQIESIEWSSFPTNASVGEAIEALGDPTVRGVGGLRIQDGTPVFGYETSGDCSFDSTTKVLSFLEQSECVVTVTVSGTRGYAKKSATFRVLPVRGDLGPTWTGYPDLNPKLTDSPLTGASPEVASPSDGNGVNYTYSVSSASASVCGVDADTGVLTLKSVGSCVVTVSASRSSYENGAVSVTVEVAKGEQRIEIDHPVYGGAAHLANGDTLSVENEPSGHGMLTYGKKNSSDNCTVSGTTGEVTANAGIGTCTVRAMRGGNEQYEASEWADIAIITMVAASQTFSWESNPYGDSLEIEVGETLALSNPSTGGTGGAEYKTADKTVCTVAADGTVTGVMVENCTVLGRWKGDATAGVSAWVPFSQAIRVTIGDGPTDLTRIGAYGAHPTLAVGGTLDVAEMTMAYGTYMYRVKSGSDTFCSVNGTNGRVTGLSVGRCVVEVLLGGNVNYRASTADLLVVTVQKGEQNLSVLYPYGANPSLVVGESLEVVGTLSGSRGGAPVYRVKTGFGSYCNVNSSSGLITALSPGNCTIEAQAGELDNYNASAWTEVVTIEVEAGTLSGIGWTPAQTRGVVGEDLELDEVDDSGAGVGVSVVYVVKDVGRTDCAFKGNSGDDARTLKFEDVGLCRIVARASHPSYHTWEREHSIRVAPGTIQLTPTAFTPNTKLKVGSFIRRPAPIGSSGVTPSDAQISWQLVRGERDCVVVDSQFGAVRARAVPIVDGETKCSLMAVAKKRGYRTAKEGPVEIFLELGDLGTINPPSYGRHNELPLGGRADLVHHAHEIHHAELTLSYTSQGTNSSDQNKSGVCSLDADGNVIAGSSGVLNDKCVISTTATAVGYNDPGAPIADVTLTLKENMVFGTLPTPAWDGILVLGESTPLNQTVTTFPGSDGSTPAVNVTWRYVVFELGGDGGIKTAGAVCTVNAGTGRVVIGSAPSRGDVCLIMMEAYADPSHIIYTKVEPVTLRVHGVLGDITAPVYTRAGFGRSVQLVVNGGRLDVAVPPSEAGHIHIEASYAAVGKRAGVETVDICTVKNDPSSADFGTVRAGMSAGKGDTCEITTTASAHLYQDKDAAVVELDLVELLQFASDPALTYSGNLKYGHTTALPPSPSLPVTDDNSVNVAWEYRVASADSEGNSFKANVCVVNMANGGLTLGGSAAVGDTCLIQAIGSATGYADVLLETIVEVEPGDLTFASATKPSYSGTLRVTGTLAPTIPGSPEDDNSISVTWGSWRVMERNIDGVDDGLDDGDVCSINESGVVGASGFSASVGDTCTIYAMATADHYRDQEEMLGILTLAAQGTFTALTPQVYTDDLTVGGSAISITTNPGANPSAGTIWTYRAEGTRAGVGTDDICSVGADGSVSPESAAVVGDVCTVSATAHLNGYADASPSPVVLTVKGEFDSLTWSSFPHSATVGNDIDLSSNRPTSSPVADGYTISIASGGCSYDEDTSTLGFTGTAACNVKVVASKTNYADKEETFTVTPGAGNLVFATVPPLVYHGRLVVGDTTTWLSRDALPAEDDNGVSVGWNLVLRGWQSSGSTTPVNNVCIFNPHNGNIRLLSGRVGNVCDIRVVGRASGYNDYTSVSRFQIVVQGVIAFSSVPTLAYGETLRYGDTTTKLVPSGLPATDDGSVGLTWHYSVQGRDSADENDKANVCTMASPVVGNADYGKIQLGSAAAVNDICRVNVIARAMGYVDYTGVADVDLTVGLGIQPHPTGWSDHYGSSPSIAVGETLDFSGTEPANSIVDGGALEYNVKNGGCTVVRTTGEVRGSDNTQSPCVIQARFAAVANKYTESAYSDVQSIAITMGTQSYTWTQTNGSVTFGNEFVLTELTGTPDGADVSYGIVSGTNTAGCAWKGTSGANARTLTFTDDGSCQVRVRVTRTSYDAWTSDPVTITVNPASWTTAPAWTGYSPGNTATYGSPAPTPAAATSTPAADWTYSTTSLSSVCTVNNSDGVLTINGDGDCVVTATAVLDGYGTHDGIERTVDIDLGTQSQPSGWSNHYGSSPSVRVGETLDVAGTEPSNSIAEGGALEYNVKSGGCTVDSSSGQVEGTDSGNSPCVIQARFAAVPNKYTASGYSDVASITVALGIQSYTAWSQTDESVTYSSGGEDVLAEFTGAADGATVYYDILGTSTASCTWKGGSGVDVRTLRFADDGVCNVQVRVTLTNHEDWTSDSATITVNPASWIRDPQWSGYVGPANGGGGNDPVRYGANVITYGPSSDPAADWTFASGTSTVCRVNPTGGGLTIVMPGECTITATPDLAGYGTHAGVSLTFRIRQGIQDPPSGWTNPYGATPVLREDETLSLDSGSTKPTGEGGLEYQIEPMDRAYCSIDINGVVTALADSAGHNCVIQARFAGNTNYTASDYETILDIIVGAGLGTLVVVAPTFTEGTNLYEGDNNRVSVETPATATDSVSNAAVTLSGVTYSVQGKRLGVDTSSICSNSSDVVRVENAAQVDDTCEVTVTASANGYDSVTVTVNLRVQSAITFAQLKTRIFDKTSYGCTTCHGASGSSGTFLASQAAMNARAGLLHASTPRFAALFSRVNGGGMPPTISNPEYSNLSSKDKDYVAAYIRGGSR